MECLFGLQVYGKICLHFTGVFIYFGMPEPHKLVIILRLSREDSVETRVPAKEEN